MSVLHRNTFHPASDLFRLFDEASSISSAPSNRRTFSPNFDVHETEHSYILEGELPGLHDKDALHLEFTDPQTLLVRGKIERSYQTPSLPRVTDTEANGDNKNQTEDAKQQEKKQQQPRYWISERSVGEFQRSFSFPTAVDVEKVKAGLEHGILKVTVPKVEHKGGRKITIS